MPTNSRWWWQIRTKTAKIVLLAGVSIMLIRLNSLCWQQRLVHAWKERSKPFLRSLWMVFQVPCLTNKGRFALMAPGGCSRQDCCCLSHVSTLRGWLKQASIRDGGTSGTWCSPALVLSLLTRRVESCLQLWQLGPTDEPSTLNLSALGYCSVTFSPFQADFLRDFWVSRSLASARLTAVSCDSVSCSTDICSLGTGIRPILERALRLSWVRKWIKGSLQIPGAPQRSQLPLPPGDHSSCASTLKWAF